MTTTTIEIDHASLELQRLPAARATPTLVFVHEGLGSVGLWKRFPAQVVARTGLPAVVYSRRGHGHSTPDDVPREVAFMHHQADVVLPQLLDALELPEVILIGHSDGASIALLYADRPDTRARKLVVIAPHVFVEDVCITSARAARRAFEAGELDRLDRYHADARHTFFAWNDIWLDPDFRAWTICDRLAGITCPTLMIQGRDDQYGTLAQLDAIAAGVAGPADALVLDDCGHSPQRDRPELVLAAIAAFVAE